MDIQLKDLCLWKLTWVPIIRTVYVWIYEFNFLVSIIRNNFIPDWTTPVRCKEHCFEGAIIRRLFYTCLYPTHGNVVKELIGDLKTGHLEIFQIAQSLWPDTVRLAYLLCTDWGRNRSLLHINFYSEAIFEKVENRLCFRMLLERKAVKTISILSLCSSIKLNAFEVISDKLNKSISSTPKSIYSSSLPSCNQAC